MPQSLAQVTLVVREYDEAIAFFRDKLGFELEPYGTVCVFEDLYSNKWDLLMPAIEIHPS